MSFIFAASDYVTPTLVGGLHGEMAGNVIQDQFTQSGNYPLGAALAILLVAGFPIILGGLAVTTRLLGRIGSWIPSPHRRHRPEWLSRVSDAALRIPYAGIVTGLLVVFLALPLLTVIFFSFNKSPVPGLPFEGFSLHWYRSVLASGQFHGALRTTLKVSALAVVGQSFWERQRRSGSRAGDPRCRRSLTPSSSPPSRRLGWWLASLY